MDEDDTEYLKDPRAKTIEGFIVALQIFAKYAEKGLQQSYVFDAHHDVLGVYFDTERIPEDSEDGLLLRQLGWHVEDDYWAYFT